MYCEIAVAVKATFYTNTFGKQPFTYSATVRKIMKNHYRNLDSGGVH